MPAFYTREKGSCATYQGYAVVIDSNYAVYNKSGALEGDPAGIIHYFTREAFEKILSMDIAELPSVLREIIENNKKVFSHFLIGWKSEQEMAVHFLKHHKLSQV